MGGHLSSAWHSWQWPWQRVSSVVELCGASQHWPRSSAVLSSCRRGRRGRLSRSSWLPLSRWSHAGSLRSSGSCEEEPLNSGRHADAARATASTSRSDSLCPPLILLLSNYRSLLLQEWYHHDLGDSLWSCAPDSWCCVGWVPIERTLVHQWVSGHLRRSICLVCASFQCFPWTSKYFHWMKSRPH